VIMSVLINIGVIGCASVADRFVIPSIKGLKNMYSLIGVASRDLIKANNFAEKFDTQAYLKYDALLELDQLDAVYIPLPNSLHKEWIEKALNRGLHVLVEKPLACSYEEALHLNTLAKRKNLLLVENFQFRFHDQLAVIKKIVSEGKIGKLRCVRSSFGFPPLPDANDIRYKRELGGGALLDAGVYPLKIAQMFLGQDIEVSCANLCLDKDKDIDIWGGAYLRQKNGPLFAEIAFGFDNYYQCNLELWGNEGKISTNRIFTAPPDFSPEIIFESSKGNKIISVEPCNQFEKMLLHFYNLITTKEGFKKEYTQNINQSRLIFEMMRIGCTRWI